MKRLRPSRAKFVDAFRWNAVLKRRTQKWGRKLSVFFISDIFLQTFVISKQMKPQ